VKEQKFFKKKIWDNLGYFKNKWKILHKAKKKKKTQSSIELNVEGKNLKNMSLKKNKKTSANISNMGYSLKFTTYLFLWLLLRLKQTTKINRLVTVKNELLFVGPITFLRLHRRLAKSTFKLLFDRWWWGMGWLTNATSSPLFFLLAGFSPPLLLSLVWGTQLKTMSGCFLFFCK